jgi:hypothetical protein
MSRRPGPRDVAPFRRRRPPPPDPRIPLNPDGPDVDIVAAAPIREVPVPERTRAGLPPGTPVRCYAMGECSIIVTRDSDAGGRPADPWHLSIAHPTRYPTWDEIARARYTLLPGVPWMAMYLPPKSEYVNIHRNCFQLLECEPPEGGPD